MSRSKLNVNWPVVVLLLVSGFVSARAGVIEQTPGADFLVVEGEDFDFLEDPLGEEWFIVVSSAEPLTTAFGSQALPEDTNASGGEALYAQRVGPFFDHATWKLQFATPGEYTLYYHYTMFAPDSLGYGNSDSFFLPLDFGEVPEQAGRSDLNAQGRGPRDDYWEGYFHWQRATIEDGSAAVYEVKDSDVGTVLDFNFATREPGGAIDLFVFSLENDLHRRPEEELDRRFLNGGAGPPLQAGDSDQDLDFDQTDLVRVQIAAKYLTGQAATWGEGDWNGAPGGQPGSPPAGNGRFDQADVVAALGNGLYLTGPYAAIARGGTSGDEQTSIVYDATTGEVAVDAPASTKLTSINIDSAGSIFTGAAANNLGGSFDNDADNNIFKATFGSSFGSLSFGNVAQTGLSEEFVLNDLTVIGSLAGGGDLGNVDLIYVPEPSTLVLVGNCLLAAIGSLIWSGRYRRSYRGFSWI